MSLLSRIERGRTPMPPQILTYGVEGIGKSIFASESPQPIFIQTEDGLGQIPPATGTSQNLHAGMERQSGHLHGDRIASQTRRGAL